MRVLPGTVSGFLVGECKSIFGHLLFAVFLLVATASVPTASRAADSWTMDATKAIVMRVYYEGLSVELAQTLPPVATTHLSAILGDPELLLDHPNAMLALGMSGHPGSYEVLRGYSLPLEGEVSRQSYRVMVARRIAMGHLGRRDPRAVIWLTEKLRDTDPDPGFSFRALKGARLARELRVLAAAAVALSGSEQARDVLHQLRNERRARTNHGATGLSVASLDAALQDLDRIRRYGPERAQAAPFSPATQRDMSVR